MPGDFDREIQNGNRCMTCHEELISDGGKLCNCGFPLFCEDCWHELPEHARGDGAPYFDMESGQVFDSVES